MNKTNFQMKGFTLGLALKQRRKATQKSVVIMLIYVKKTVFFFWTSTILSHDLIVAKTSKVLFDQFADSVSQCGHWQIAAMQMIKQEE